MPQFQRNLLISPPGSPFDGWEQIEEDAPNQAVLASDLMHAAEISDYELDDDELELEAIHKEKMEIKKQQKAISIVCSRGSEQLEHLPSITVQDWDGHTQLEFDGPKEEGKRKKKNVNDIVPTAMPPRKSWIAELLNKWLCLMPDEALFDCCWKHGYELIDLFKGAGSSVISGW